LRPREAAVESERSAKVHWRDAVDRIGPLADPKLELMHAMRDGSIVLDLQPALMIGAVADLRAAAVEGSGDVDGGHRVIAELIGMDEKIAETRFVYDFT